MDREVYHEKDELVKYCRSFQLLKLYVRRSVDPRLVRKDEFAKETI